MACRNCVMCLSFSGMAGVPDGYYKRIQEEGAPKWFGLDGKEADATVSAALESAYTTQTRVDCSLYESQINASSRFVLLEEVDSTTKQPTGVVVQLETKPDGTLVYTNLSTSAPYTPPANTSLVLEEDSDFTLVQTPGCDNGVSIEKREWIRAGDATAISSTVIVVATSAPHTLSGSEVWGSHCVAGTIFGEPKLFCAKIRAADAPAPIPAGTETTKLYRVIEQDVSTGIPVSTKYYKQSDNTEVTVGPAAGQYWVDDNCC
ncbi:MAG: hypothetical protein E6Q83_03520 [Thiothrix sp.]|nr:MAG: hypothetical protein E6Q83_03520 [Thiothrix sp.]